MEVPVKLKLLLLQLLKQVPLLQRSRHENKPRCSVAAIGRTRTDLCRIVSQAQISGKPLQAFFIRVLQQLASALQKQCSVANKRLARTSVTGRNCRQKVSVLHSFRSRLKLKAMTTRKLTCREEFNRPAPVRRVVPESRGLQLGRPMVRVLRGTGTANSGQAASKGATRHEDMCDLEGNDLVQSGGDTAAEESRPFLCVSSSPPSAHRQMLPRQQQPLYEKLRSRLEEHRLSFQQPCHLQSRLANQKHDFHPNNHEHELLHLNQDREFRPNQEREFRLTHERQFQQHQEQAYQEYRERQEGFQGQNCEDPMGEQEVEKPDHTALHGKPTVGNTANGEKTRYTKKNPLPRYKRPAHIDAEYRRRGKIQKGFELVQSLVPALNENSGNGKVSKASMLFKTSVYLRELAADVEHQKSEMERLRAEVESPQKEIEGHQQLLPSSGVNVVERPGCHVDRMLDEYLHAAISQDWKFWIFSFLVRPLSESFTRNVSLSTHDDFVRTIHEWSDSQLNLVNLRPMVLSLLRSICTTTSIMSEPEKLEEEVHAMANFDVKPAAL